MDDVPSDSRLRDDIDVLRSDLSAERRLSGKRIAWLMRRYRVTIRELSQRTGITMKRIREVRDAGLDDRNAIRDWIEAITGQDPGAI